MASSPRLDVLAGHADGVCVICLSTNERLLATADWEGWVYLWNLQVDAGVAARVLRRPPIPRGPSWSPRGRPPSGSYSLRVDWLDALCFSSDGRFLLIGTWRGVEIHDLRDPAARPRRVAGLRGRLTPDGSGVWALSGKRGGRIVLLDPETGTRTTTVRLRPPVAWASSREAEPHVDVRLRRIEQVVDGERRVWDLDSGRLVDGPPNAEGPVVVLPSDGVEEKSTFVGSRSVAVGRGDGSVTVCGRADGHPWFVAEHVNTRVVDIAFTSRSVVAAYGDGVVREWNLNTGCFSRAVRPTWGSPLALHPDGCMLLTAEGDTAWAWDLDSGSLINRYCLGGPPVRRGALSGTRGASLCVLSGTTHLAEGAQSAAWLGDTCVFRAVGGRQAHAVAASPRGDCVASAWRKGLVIAWTDGRAFRYAMPDSRDTPASVAFTPDGRRVIVGSSSYHFDVFRLDEARWEERRYAHRDSVAMIRGTSAGQIDGARACEGFGVFGEGGPGGRVRPPPLAIAAVTHYASSVFLGSGGQARALFGHRANTTAVAFAKDGLLASGARDGSICLWREGELQAILQVLPRPSEWVSFTPKGRYVASEGAPRFVNGGTRVGSLKLGHGLPVGT